MVLKKFFCFLLLATIGMQAQEKGAGLLTRCRDKLLNCCSQGSNSESSSSKLESIPEDVELFDLQQAISLFGYNKETSKSVDRLIQLKLHINFLLGRERDGATKGPGTQKIRMLLLENLKSLSWLEPADVDALHGEFNGRIFTKDERTIVLKELVVERLENRLGIVKKLLNIPDQPIAKKSSKKRKRKNASKRKKGWNIKAVLNRGTSLFRGGSQEEVWPLVAVKIHTPRGKPREPK